jgi:hypothetical protein
MYVYGFSRGVEKDLVSSAEIKNDKNTAIDGNTIDTLWREFIEESCSNPTTDQISEQKEDKIKSPKSDQKYTGTNGQAEVNEIRTKTGLKRK